MGTKKKNPLAAAKWIGGDTETVSPLITRRFDGEKVRKATLFVTGLGFFEAKINGQAVSEGKFVPVVSDYEPRQLEQFLYPLHDETTHAIYYYTYDVTSLIRNGKNVLTIWLGNG